MPELNLNSVLSKRTELLSSEIDGEVVMMNIETGNYISMNEVGSEIWKMIEQQPSSVKEICQQLKKSFNVDQITCEKETINFCSKMLNENLIRLL